MAPRADERRFRKGVCGIFLSANGELLLGERLKERGQWQLPQGGIDKGETADEALNREMWEETGVKKVIILKKTLEYIGYEWPQQIKDDLNSKKKNKYDGQSHIYYLLDGSHVDPESMVSTEEFAAFCWVPAAEAIRRVVGWRKLSYIQAFEELGL